MMLLRVALIAALVAAFALPIVMPAWAAGKSDLVDW
jgi:hypothetical protein